MSILITLTVKKNIWSYIEITDVWNPLLHHVEEGMFKIPWGGPSTGIEHEIYIQSRLECY